MAASNRSSKITVILLMAVCALGGALANSSFSQNGQRVYDGTEVGRYQLVNAHQIFDTKTARLWRFQANEEFVDAKNGGATQGGKWVWDEAPWEWNRTPHNKSKMISLGGFPQPRTSLEVGTE